ncbi:hypothetical protein KIN20_003766 [Parelaphostrongylus tenuis]|uniref:Uncharacterized protein n=1 Tax=Parelaphostrongylus tenuis TaxID=148309 RepID=A0AAD5MQE0_PARTN|nr:hypothetical protein KIN20_003766 [Parelaphostrongylus tenuis]
MLSDVWGWLAILLWNSSKRVEDLFNVYSDGNSGSRSQQHKRSTRDDLVSPFSRMAQNLTSQTRILYCDERYDTKETPSTVMLQNHDRSRYVVWSMHDLFPVGHQSSTRRVGQTRDANGLLFSEIPRVGAPTFMHHRSSHILGPPSPIILATMRAQSTEH